MGAMKYSKRTVCLLLTGLICVFPISGCSSDEGTKNSSVTESRVSSGQVSVSDNLSSEFSSADDVSDENASKESSTPKESKVSEVSIPTENSFTGRFVRTDPLAGSEDKHLNYELELSEYNDKLYLRVLSMDMQYDPELDVEGYDANIVRNENVELIAAAPYDPSSDIFVFTADDDEITVKYSDQHDLEVTAGSSSEYGYLTDTYIYQPPVDNPFPTPEAIHDPKTPDGKMDAGIAESVRVQLGLDANAEITEEDCKKITRLYIVPQPKPATSLDGIEYFSGLKELEVGDSTVRDISALSTLTELESISFTNSMIEIIPDLSACKKLKKVEFINDFISDISPLAKLQNLETVMLISDQVRSIAPLKDNHTIKSLTLTNTCVTDWDSIGDNEDLKKALFCDYKYYLEMQNKAKKIISENITDDMSDLEKQVRLAKYVEDFMEYEFAEDDPDLNVPFGYQGIVENKGVCANYAYAAKYLMNLAGLEVIVCTSYDHDWNMINLNGKWYEFDCTWDDEKDIEDWSWFNRSSAAVTRNDHHCQAMPERMPYAAEDMPFTEYGRFGALPD